MATANLLARTTTGRPPRRREPAPFDQRLSTAIDVNIIRAESTSNPVKRELLRLQRRWYEYRVPAGGLEVVR